MRGTVAKRLRRQAVGRATERTKLQVKVRREKHRSIETGWHYPLKSWRRIYQSLKKSYTRGGASNA